MKTMGLIIIWFAMTVILIFGYENIEDMRFFHTICSVDCIFGMYNRAL